MTEINALYSGVSEEVLKPPIEQIDDALVALVSEVRQAGISDILQSLGDGSYEKLRNAGIEKATQEPKIMDALRGAVRTYISKKEKAVIPDEQLKQYIAMIEDLVRRDVLTIVGAVIALTMSSSKPKKADEKRGNVLDREMVNEAKKSGSLATILGALKGYMDSPDSPELGRILRGIDTVRAANKRLNSNVKASQEPS